MGAELERRKGEKETGEMVRSNQRQKTTSLWREKKKLGMWEGGQGPCRNAKVLQGTGPGGGRWCAW